MAGVPLPAPPQIPPLRDPEANAAIQSLLVYLDALRRQIERDYA